MEQDCKSCRFFEPLFLKGAQTHYDTKWGKCRYYDKVTEETGGCYGFRRRDSLYEDSAQRLRNKLIALYELLGEIIESL